RVGPGAERGNRAPNARFPARWGESGAPRAEAWGVRGGEAPGSSRRRRMRTGLFIALLLVASSAGSLMGQRGAGAGPPNPFLGNAQAVAEGETLYNQKCTTCHGSGGGDGEIGPAIVSGDRLDIGVSDAQTFNIIKNGVAGTPITAQRLPGADIWK